MEKRTVRLVPLAAILLVGLVGVGGAQGATVAAPGLSVDASTIVTPNRLPRHGAAPVKLAVNWAITWTDPASLNPLRDISLALDRQLTVDTTGLPTCTVHDIHELLPNQARKKCGASFIGSGTAIDTFHFPEQQPFALHRTLLFFNTRVAGRPQVLLYTCWFRDVGVYPLGGSRSLRFQFGRVSPETESFQFHLGKTWRYRGQKHSYLSGRCTTGTLSNQITLGLSDGEVSSPLTERCTKQA